MAKKKVKKVKESLDEIIFDDVETLRNKVRELHQTINSSFDNGVGTKELGEDFIEYYGNLIDSIKEDFDVVKKKIKTEYKL